MSPLKSLTINEFFYIRVSFIRDTLCLCGTARVAAGTSHLLTGGFVVVVVVFFPNGTGTKSNNKKKGKKE